MHDTSSRQIEKEGANVAQMRAGKPQLWGNQIPSWLRLAAPIQRLRGEHEDLQPRQENVAGLPEALKESVEQRSGLSLRAYGITDAALWKRVCISIDTILCA